MASLSTGFKGLNLGAEQTDKVEPDGKQVVGEGDGASEPNSEVVAPTLGAIPKQPKKKKSDRNRNRNKKAVNEPLVVTQNPMAVTQNPITLTQNPTAEVNKTPNVEKRLRRGKRHLKTINVENDDNDVGEKTSNKENNDCDDDVDVGVSVGGDDDDDEEAIRFGNDPVPYAWKNVTKSGSIKKCILVDGKPEFGRPQAGDAVLVKTQGKLRNGTVIDDHPTFIFNIGEHEVIEGLDLVVRSMFKNELSIVSIKPELAYGTVGRSRTMTGKLEEIPGNERITYLLGLLHFEKSRDRSTLTWAQRRKCGQSKMRLANWWFQRKEYSVAIKCYKKALTYYNDVPPNHECSNAAEYKELMLLLEERLRVMRQVANIFKRIANLIQSGQISI